MESIKQPDVPLERKRELKVQRTKLSLWDPDKYDEYFSSDISKEMSGVRLNFFSRELHVFDVTKKLALAVTPTLIICGRHDVQCPIEYSIEMGKLIPNASLAIFERSNHYPFLEEAEQFIETYQSFRKNLAE